MRIYDEKPVAILIFLLDNGCSYITQIQNAVDTTTAHTLRIINFFEHEKIVATSKTSRIRKVQLTAKGIEVAEHLKETERIMGDAL